MLNRRQHIDQELDKLTDDQLDQVADFIAAITIEGGKDSSLDDNLWLSLLDSFSLDEDELLEV